MHEWQRRTYLEALGIDLWEPRAGAWPAAATDREPAAAASLEDTGMPEYPDPDADRPDAETGIPTASAGRPAYPAAGTGPVDTRDRASAFAALAPADPFDAPDPADPAALDWPALEAAVAGCRACALHETRTRTVFGVGDRSAALMIVGEAPGADEDRAGEPFVGRAGQLLNRMLAAIELEREQVFIANILKCRPPGNRDPRPDEAMRCEGYLRRQIALIRPRLILAAGRVSAQHLLRTDASVGQLRGRWHVLDTAVGEIPLRVTYHPAYLLRSPEQKARAWEDLTVVARRLAEPHEHPSL